MMKALAAILLLAVLFGCTQQPQYGSVGAAGDPSKFGTANNTTVYIGGAQGVVNATGSLIGANLFLTNLSCGIGEVLKANATGDNRVKCIPTPAGAEVDPYFTAANGSIVYKNGSNSITGATINASNVTSPPWLTSFTELDPTFSTENATLVRNGSKTCSAGYVLQNATINRTGLYGDCVLDQSGLSAALTGIASPDGSLVIQSNASFANATINNSQFYNQTYANSTFLKIANAGVYNESARIDSLNNTKLDNSDQRFNESGRVDTLNSTKGATGNCTGQFMTGIGSASIYCGTPAGSGNMSGSGSSSGWAFFINNGLIGGSALSFSNITLGTVSDAQMANQKLNLTDQRYNESARVDAVNSSTQALISSNTTTNARADSLNSTKAQTGACSANQFAIALNSGTAPTCAQPASANLSDSTNIPKLNTANVFTSSMNATQYNITGSGNFGGGSNATCTRMSYNSTFWFGVGPGCG